MNIELYDGIADVSVLNGVVRVEFFNLLAERRGPRVAGEPPQIERQTARVIALPMTEFARAVDLLVGVREQLVKSGVLQRAEPPPADVGPKISPNFS